MPKLTLSRKEGEALIIDHDIRVIIQKARNGQARITIDAPEEVNVIREELDGLLEAYINKCEDRHL